MRRGRWRQARGRTEKLERKPNAIFAAVEKVTHGLCDVHAKKGGLRVSGVERSRDWLVRCSEMIACARSISSRDAFLK